jgi:hypothetical protein
MRSYVITGAIIGAIAVSIVAAYEFLGGDANEDDSMGPNPFFIGMPVIAGGAIGAIVYAVKR